MSLGTPYKRAKLDEYYDAIVIGSGIGGLATAAMLAKHKGQRVLVLERHYTAGGFTHTFRRPGFEWDVGVHYIGDVQRQNSSLRRVFDHITDGALQWADMGDVYDSIRIGSDRYDFVAGRKNFVERMSDYFPGEAQTIQRYVDLIGSVAKRSRLFFAEKVVPTPISGLFGNAMRAPTLRYAERTAAEVLRELTANERLIGVLAGQWGDYGLPPAQSSFFMHAILAQHYLGGASYPVGGAARIAETIAPLIKKAGGDILVRAEVSEILSQNGKAIGVRMEDGRELRATTIISDAGIANTFGKLLPSINGQRESFLKESNRIGPSLAHLSLYVGTNQTAQELGLEKTNQWIYETHNHDENVARYLADPNSAFPVVYLSFPSAKDPDFENRHPGAGTIEAITMVPYQQFAQWSDTRWQKRGEDYDAFKQTLADRLRAALIKACPQVKDAIVHAELSTPLTTRDFAGHQHGEVYGLAHTPARFATRTLKPRTPIKNLYLTGSDVCTAGVGGALMGGIMCAAAIAGPKMMSAAMSG